MNNFRYKRVIILVLVHVAFACSSFDVYAASQATAEVQTQEEPHVEMIRRKNIKGNDNTKIVLVQREQKAEKIEKTTSLSIDSVDASEEKKQVEDASLLSPLAVQASLLDISPDSLQSKSNQVAALSKEIQDDKSLNSQEKNKLLSACALICKAINYIGQGLGSGIKFLCSVKGVGTILILAFVVKKITGVHYLKELLIPLIQDFCVDLGDLTGNLVGKSFGGFVHGLYKVLEDCQNAEACSVQITTTHKKLGSIASFAVKSILQSMTDVEQGVSEGLMSFVSENPFYAMLPVGLILACYHGPYALFLPVGVFALSKIRRLSPF